MKDSDSPLGEAPSGERQIDYLICNDCHTPCYVFETDKGEVTEAQCLACGNDKTALFLIGGEASDEEP